MIYVLAFNLKFVILSPLTVDNETTDTVLYIKDAVIIACKFAAKFNG